MLCSSELASGIGQSLIPDFFYPFALVGQMSQICKRLNVQEISIFTDSETCCPQRMRTANRIAIPVNPFKNSALIRGRCVFRKSNLNPPAISCLIDVIGDGLGRL